MKRRLRNWVEKTIDHCLSSGGEQEVGKKKGDCEGDVSPRRRVAFSALSSGGRKEKKRVEEQTRQETKGDV